MLYFMGYNDSTGNWTGNFTEAVKNGLQRRQVEFQELPPFDWQSTNPPINYYLSIDSCPDDVWFIGWAQSPIIELIHDKPGMKIGMVVGLTAMPFEPAVLWEAEHGLQEAKRLSLYDKIFANSHWCSECICNAYPHLADRVAVTGFPIDYSVYAGFRDVPKDPKLVVFNQRFALEKLHIIELQVAQRLVRAGWTVQHLSGITEPVLAGMSRSMRPLLEVAGRIGLEFKYNATKEQYHDNLARASVVITTSIADMLPSSLIEAIYMGARPVAPNSQCFPEFVHKDNLYPPYDIDEIVTAVNEGPAREHPIHRYDKDVVIRRFLDEMEK